MLVCNRVVPVLLPFLHGKKGDEKRESFLHLSFPFFFPHRASFILTLLLQKEEKSEPLPPTPPPLSTCAYYYCTVP